MRKLSDGDAKRGVSAIELIVVAAIFAALVTIAVPFLSSTPSRVAAATHQLAGDIETYAIHRMRRSLGRWQVEEEPVRTGALPAGVAFAGATEEDGAEVELDSRGFLTPPDGAPCSRSRRRDRRAARAQRAPERPGGAALT